MKKVFDVKLFKDNVEVLPDGMLKIKIPYNIMVIIVSLFHISILSFLLQYQNVDLNRDKVYVGSENPNTGNPLSFILLAQETYMNKKTGIFIVKIPVQKCLLN